jgi:hypothetical protein
VEGRRQPDLRAGPGGHQRTAGGVRETVETNGRAARRRELFLFSISAGGWQAAQSNQGRAIGRGRPAPASSFTRPVRFQHRSGDPDPRSSRFLHMSGPAMPHRPLSFLPPNASSRPHLPFTLVTVCGVHDHTSALVSTATLELRFGVHGETARQISGHPPVPTSPHSPLLFIPLPPCSRWPL